MLAWVPSLVGIDAIRTCNISDWFSLVYSQVTLLSVVLQTGTKLFCQKWRRPKLVSQQECNIHFVDRLNLK